MNTETIETGDTTTRMTAIIDEVITVIGVRASTVIRVTSAGFTVRLPIPSTMIYGETGRITIGAGIPITGTGGVRRSAATTDFLLVFR